METEKKLAAYDVVWNSPSEDSRGSMPVGNGDITANVWAEADGTFSFYIGKSDTWSEATRLLKVGKVKVQISPNPFADTGKFQQRLLLKDGEIVIRAGEADSPVTMRIWADANHPAIRAELDGPEKYKVQVTGEVLRKAPRKAGAEREERQKNNWNFYNSPVEEPEESADILMERPDGIGWYHRNETSPYHDILTYQNVGELYRPEQDPYLHRTFGAFIKGEGLTKKDETHLEGEGRGSYRFSVYVHTALTETAKAWEEELEQIMREEEDFLETLRAEHQAWWASFWDRSWIFAEGDEAAETVTRGYLMQRYLQAIQGRGAYPIKFNGGSLTVDYRGENPDHRDWGAPYWFQNTRLLYWNMLAAGDFDMMRPFFSMYRNALELQKQITGKYYGHEGAFFPETTNIFGGYTLLDFYWGDMTPHEGTEPRNRYVRYYWQGALELSAMMLEYYEYTGEEEFLRETAVPFAEQILLFYDRHFPRDGKGQLRITPTHSLETYWDDVCNPSEQLAGLRAVLKRLLGLKETQITPEQRARWERFYGEIPELPMGTDENGAYLEVAEAYGSHRYNNENPELYAVFPYKLCGVGKEQTELAKGAWDRRKSTFNYCWSQNGIHAAYLGLAEEAKDAVISHFSNQAQDARFPAFWDKGNDWLPDLDNGGSAMSALQAMLVQCDGEDIKTLPAWPKEWSVDCRLHVTGQRTVRIRYQAGSEKGK